MVRNGSSILQSWTCTFRYKVEIKKMNVFLQEFKHMLELLTGPMKVC